MTRIDPYSDLWDDFTKKVFRLSREDLVGMLDSLELRTWTSDFEGEKGELVVPTGSGRAGGPPRRVPPHAGHPTP